MPLVDRLRLAGVAVWVDEGNIDAATLWSESIVEAIAERPEIAALIDELYFEYHFYFDGHNFGWGSHGTGDVDTAVSLMHRLRTLGIRAHFWI